MAPEAFDSYCKDVYKTPVDIWALGVTMYVFLTGEFPYNGKNLSDIEDAHSTTRLNYFSKEWEGVSYDAKDLVKKMLD